MTAPTKAKPCSAGCGTRILTPPGKKVGRPRTRCSKCGRR